MPPQITRPTMPELPKLHQELGLWMAHTRYQVQPPDQIQIWRVQNTSIALATGAGIGTFFLLKRVRPSMKFPIDIIPPFVTFYLTHRAAQIWQLPSLYDSFLDLTTPLGFKAREILEAVRADGRLPSHEFGTQMPQAGASRTPPAPRGAPPPAPAPEARDGDFSFAAFPPPVAETSGPGYSNMGMGKMEGDIPAPSADPWSEAGLGGGSAGEPAAPGGPTEGWDFSGPGGAQTEGAGRGAPPRRRSWEEIRADQAKRQSGQQSE
mmetsp:Transcript_79078/g.255570  ORF Transcript_79078/g.255570 Transcript_79078/m.255570 type:complete len:264 (-) Transcript_79078:176-967(-)